MKTHYMISERKKYAHTYAIIVNEINSLTGLMKRIDLQDRYSYYMILISRGRYSSYNVRATSQTSEVRISLGTEMFEDPEIIESC